MASISFGGELKHIGDAAFYNCISLESVVFQEGLTNLGARTFYGPSRLKSVSLPASLEYIGDDAFKGSVHITGVTVPTHLKTMRELFPDSYWNIESVVIPSGEGVIIDSMFEGCRALNSIIIPNTVTNIGASAFEWCDSLQEIGIPDSVVTLGTAAFSNCRQLKTIALSKALSSIADRTFEVCINLNSLVLPASVKSLGSCIFSGYWFPEGYGVVNGPDRQLRKVGDSYSWYYYMQALTGVYFLGDAPEVQSDTYEGMPSALTSYVVKGSTGWYLAGAPTLPPDGWPMSGNSRPITYWTPNEFEVTFDGNGGSPETYVAKQITDTTYSLPKTNPTRTGYLFDGWWTEKTAGAQVYWNSRVTATKAQTLYAHWKALSDGITVVFNPCGGTVDPDEMTFPAGITYGSLPVPTRIGHLFLGWYTSPSGGTKITESSEVSKENNELYAHWTPITYIVRYNANGGTGSMSDQTHTYNVKQKLRPFGFYNQGYAFLGWATSAGGAVAYANEKEVENLAELQGQVVNLYAVWNDASYSVRFDANGGYGWMDNQTFAVDANQAIAKCTLTREGYAFAGWAKTYDGKVAYADEQVVKNLTTIKNSTVVLYAVWRENSVMLTVEFDAQGGECAETERSVEDGQIIGTLPTPTRGKYKFDGWYTAATGGTKVTASTKVSADVTYYAHWTYDGSTTVAVNVGSGCEGMGTVSGGKTAKAGTKLTLKAMAAKGYVFAGWYLDDAIETIASTCVSHAASYTYVVDEEDVTLYAKFIPTSEDYVDVWADFEDEYERGEAIEPIAIVVDSGSLATVKVTGLPTGLKFTAKALSVKATKKTPAAEYAANTIYGTPTRSGVYTVTVAATTAGKVTAAETFKIVVRADGETVVNAEWETAKGKVTGMGICANGKTLTLKAVANKGYVFAGWYSDVAIPTCGDEVCGWAYQDPVEGTADYRTASLAVKGDGSDVTYYARFAAASEDGEIRANIEDEYVVNGPWTMKLNVESLSLPSVTVKGLPRGLKFDAKTLTISGTPTKPGVYTVTLSLKNVTVKKAKSQTFKIKVANIESPYLTGVPYETDAYNYHVGVAVGWDIGASATAGYAVSSVSGLPTGLKYNAKTGMIEGVPSKAGTYTAAITLKNGKLTSLATVTLNVMASDSWAFGTFNGGADNGGAEDGQVQLTITSAGKLSGKWLEDGITYTLSAPSFSGYESASIDCPVDTYFATVTASWSHKDGKKTVKESESWSMTVEPGDVGGIATTGKFTAWQNVWAQSSWKTFGLSYFGKSGTTKKLSGEAYGLGEGESISMTIKPNGVVTLKGTFDTGVVKNGKPVYYTASGSAVVCVTASDPFDGLVFAYFAPNTAKNFNGYVRVVTVGD